MKRLSRAVAQELLYEAGAMNRGGWVDHSLNVARAAEAIASVDPGLDPDRAFAFGCIHDIGRRCGVTEMRHVYDGFRFLAGQGYNAAARICLTHSFPIKTIDAVSGWDCSRGELRAVRDFLAQCRYTRYDRLIQLCDALALPSGFCLIEKRLVDVALRRGVNSLTLRNWRAYLEIQRDFESRINQSIYSLLPGVVRTTFGASILE
jgi:HD domain